MQPKRHAKSWKLCKRAASFSILFFLLTGCGYRWACHEGDRTITIPYIAGDEDGAFTAELIRSFSAASALDVVSDGRYFLDVKVVQEEIDTLGFRRDPQKVRGKLRKNLIQNEARKTLFVDVALFEKGSVQPVCGPLRISDYVDFDYVDMDSLLDLQFENASGKKITVLPFSLGQLESQEAAQEATLRPLYRKLSQKIVDVISARW
jgi:hypothetical protein